MQFLKSILPLVDRAKFIADHKDSAQLVALFETIRTNGEISDEEAYMHLYNGSDMLVAYKKLKQRLREQVIDHAIKYGISYKNLDSYALQYRKCLQKLFAVKTLSLNNARSAAIYVAENLLKISLDNEYTDINMYLAAELNFYYSAVDYHRTKSRKYRKLAIEMEALHNREMIAMRYYCDLRILFASSRASQKDRSLQKAIDYSAHLQQFIESKNTSYQLILTSYLVIAMRYEIARDYTKLLETCDLAIEAFANRKVSRKIAFFSFDLRRIVCYLQLKQYHKVQGIAEKYFDQLTPGQLNWFVLKSYVILSYLHAQDYNNAYLLLKEIKASKHYKTLSKSIAQTLSVYEAHIQFLVSINKISASKKDSDKFRLYKFLNDIPIFSKDKRGLNIAILIVHVLFLLRDKKYSDIIDRIDALNQYCHRYLRKDDTFRSNCFIKMLLKVAKANFNRKRAQRYVEPLLIKLQSSSVIMSDQSVEVEIIPYEHLWHMVLELLDQ